MRDDGSIGKTSTKKKPACINLSLLAPLFVPDHELEKKTRPKLDKLAQREKARLRN